MNKDFKTIVTEYGNSLSDEELKWIAVRFSDRFQGDLAEALEAVSKNKRIDYMLSSVDSADGLFDMCDELRDSLRNLCKKKGLIKAA